MATAKASRAVKQDEEFTYDEYMLKFKSKTIGEEDAGSDDAEEVGAEMAEQSLAILRAALSRH